MEGKYFISFADKFDSSTYNLDRKPIRYNRKLVGCTPKISAFMDRIVNPYKFEIGNLGTILSFPGPFKRACDSRKIFVKKTNHERLLRIFSEDTLFSTVLLCVKSVEPLTDTGRQLQAF